MSGIAPEIIGVAAGITISSLNAVAGIAIARRSAQKSLKDALTLVIAGMFVRLFVVAIITWICLAVYNLNAAYFTLSLMISFFLLLMIETFFFHTKTKQEPKPYLRRPKRRRAALDSVSADSQQTTTAEGTQETSDTTSSI